MGNIAQAIIILGALYIFYSFEVGICGEVFMIVPLILFVTSLAWGIVEFIETWYGEDNEDSD